ncbi:MAG TPA: N-acetylmuramoyl-L-alanine amidase [Gemmatimonadaceae bacterium]|jgi:N-acetylmuramoyl-L-alanine amidase|nr:N-acetylmuramoyl-L-alanine amidase [Gemmatimonadaceae bacterium]
MIAALALLVQQAAVQPFTNVTIRHGESSASVPVVLMERGPFVGADTLAALLSGTVTRAADEYVIAAAGIRAIVVPHVPFVRIGEQTLPLPADPVVRAGKLYVPYAFLSDLLPRVAKGVTFDDRRGVLRRELAVAPAARPASSSTAREKARPAKQPMFTVVVDAGHGGPDAGMRGPIGAKWQIREKDITLAVARALREELIERGVAVIMTRSTDTLIALSDRGRIANSKKGDVFLSVHVNAASPRWKQPGAARGYETYFLSEARTEDAKRVEAMENEVVKYEIASEVPPDDPLSFIVHDMEQNQHLRESSELAATVQRGLAKIHPGPNRGVKQAGFRVLVTAFMPSVLIEIGFGTNPAEARYLRDPKRQRQIATSIADATMEYLASYHRRSTASGQ